MVPPRKPDVLEVIIMLPTRPHTLLRARRPAYSPASLVPEKNVLKSLIHPRIGKQQRRIIRRAPAKKSAPADALVRSHRTPYPQKTAKNPHESGYPND